MCNSIKKKFSSLLHEFRHAAFRKRSYSQSKLLDTKLDRCLSTYQLVFYGISHMVGAGIYVLTGHLIKERVGPATNLSFLFSGLISIFTGLCYCEFATLIPKAGSCYTYTYLMMGELPAFIIGWTMLLDSIISLSSVSKGFSGSINLLTNYAVKNFTDKYVPLARNSDIWESSVDLIAFLLLFTLFLITLLGANISMTINSVVAVVQLCLLSIIIIACFIYGSNKNYIADGGYLPFGSTSILQGAGIAIFAYSGFESLANSAEETKDPKKSIPIALFMSLGIVIILYFFASSGLSYMVPRLEIDQKSPFISAFNKPNLIHFKWIAAIGTLLATGATKLAMIYVIPRMLYAMANDGLLFKFMAKIDERTKVPIVGLLVGLFISSILAMFVKIEVLADITSMGIVLSFIIIGVDLIILRYINKREMEENDLKSLKIPMRTKTKMTIDNRRFFILIFLLFIFSVISLGLCILFVFDWSNIAGIVISIIAISLGIIFIAIISLYEPSSTDEGFVTPWMPLAPIVTITLNICVLINLPGLTWLRFLIWIAIGFVIYIFYGIRNSKLSLKYDVEKINIIETEYRKFN